MMGSIRRMGGAVMQTLRKIKIGPFLMIFSVLAVWTLLAVGSVQAHTTTLSAPSCTSSNLPTADGFFAGTGTTDSDTRLEIIASRLSAPFTDSNNNVITTTLDTKRGTDTAKEGKDEYRYAKITIPALAAGELRVFDARTTNSDVSAAALCRGSTRIASYSKSYSSHNASSHTNTTEHDDHETFEIRAQVSPGDEEYIVIVASHAPGTDPKLNVDFHGAIAKTATTTLKHSLNTGSVHTHEIKITAPGLLTVETKGSTDTQGMLDDEDNMEVGWDESGGSGSNFRIVAPVTKNTAATDYYKVVVEGQTPETKGDYTLDMDFKVAMTHKPALSVAGVTMVSGPNWTNIDVTDDGTANTDTPEIKKDEHTSPSPADEDYFLFTIGAAQYGFLTVEATDDGTAAKDADTKGALFGELGDGPMAEVRVGQIATDTSSGAGNHFKFRVPVEPGNYLVKVTGSEGAYRLKFTFDSGAGNPKVPSTNSLGEALGCNNDDDLYEICAASSTDTETERERYVLDITGSGALYVHTTGDTDTVGTLYGPDGRQLGTDDNSGSGKNFRIAVNVKAGLHLVEVRGKERTTQGLYDLVVNFIQGATPTNPTDPTDPTDPTCPTDPPVQTDAHGNLGNPSNNGYRSGIGVISGWVCAANEVEVRIRNSRDVLVRTLDVAHGTSRPDTVGQCSHRSANTGFGMTYNFNHLDEGTYTITAYADDRQIGESRTFEVVHISAFADTDTGRFIRDLPDGITGECIVPDFPKAGERTWLLWEESTQNFVIEDQG